LLEDRMSVKGELILISQSGHRWTIQLEFTASDGENTFIEELRTPGKLLATAGAICMIWILIGMFERRNKIVPTQDNNITEPLQQLEIEPMSDAWGRSIDELE
ncbi:MAG: hypothetical protein HOH79_00875, partial [Euryarchaeota archaeon]|nr:hypothetical protein [Euryarchaeota archaeon]MBT6845463.1 hypothetical protein [Euryarchaeota archaeon]